MDESVKEWLVSLEKGISSLPREEKEHLFSECGKNCAIHGVLAEQKKVYEESGKDLDTFYSNLKQLGKVEGEVVKSDKEYNLYFDGCLCGLFHEGYMNSSELCECSRQSIIYILNTLVPERNWHVTLVDTVIGGAK